MKWSALISKLWISDVLSVLNLTIHPHLSDVNSSETIANEIICNENTSTTAANFRMEKWIGKATINKT